MEKMKWIRKGISALLALNMVLSSVPLPAFAAGEDNLCEHHPIHTAECHYAEAVAGQPCTHEHSEDCYEILECLHACGTECEQDCTHVCELKMDSADSCYKLLCSHAAGGHDDACGYVAAVEAHDCHYACDACAAALTSAQETDPAAEPTTKPTTEPTTKPSIEPAPVCTCESDDPQWHAPFCDLYTAPEHPECYCVEKCGDGWVNEWCEVCYFNPGACWASGEEEAAAYPSTPTYIASLGIAQDADKSDAINELSGHTVIDYDLNKGCGSSSDYIYMGYKTTTDPSKAITGIFIRTGKNPPASATFDGVTAYLVGGSYEANTAVDNVVDLNEDAGGSYIYVYVTRDTSRAPVTEITFSSSSSKSDYTTPNVDLNQGVGGSDDIYLHYKQFSATVSSTYYYLRPASNGADSETTSSTQSATVKNHLEKMTTVPSVSTTAQVNGMPYTFMGWREDDNIGAPTVSSPSATYMTGNKAYRAVYQGPVLFHFYKNDGSGAPENMEQQAYLTVSSSKRTIRENKTFTIPNTTYTNINRCKFLGWNTSSRDTTALYVPGQKVTVSNNTFLYAIYQKDHDGTKIYVDNGTNHTYTWSCCNLEVTENHTFTDTKCVCGARDHVCVYTNGFCEKGCYEPAQLVDGYYQITNGGNLFWFAEYINTVDRTANARLTADINLEGRPWTPIGSTGEDSNNFRGVFDGQNHTIRGLYVEGSRAGLGFFGEVRTGTVKNFTIYGEVNVIGSYDYVGGVIGSACGLNSNKPDQNGATIQNITSYVNLTAGAHGIGMVGGFIGYANHKTVIENCSWYGTFDAGIYRVDSGAGGFIGRIYDTATVTIRNCGAYGTIKTAYQSGTFNNQATIYIGGFLSYSPSGAKTVLENNLWAGSIINNTNLTAANAHLSAYGTLSSDASITNCYALDSTPDVTTNDANSGDITTVTAERLKSGEVAYKLGAAWGQTIGTQNYPVLGGQRVYQVKNCIGKTVYSNTNENIGHIEVNGFCTVCGTLLCDHSGNKNRHTDCTKDLICSICGEVATPAAQSHTPGQDDGNCTTAVMCANCEQIAVAAKTHNYDSDGKCRNGGCKVIQYNLWVGGEQFTSDNLTVTGTTGTATYDPETNTLSLNGYTYEGVGYDYYGDVWAIGSQDERPLKLVLEGKSAVSVTGTETHYSYGVYASGDLEISGTGSLTATGGNTDSNSYGVYALGSITVSGGTMTATGGAANKYSYGVFAYDITVSGTGSLTATGGNTDYESYGVQAGGTVAVSETGKLTADGGSAEYSHGLHAAGDLEVSGTGCLTATASNADYQSLGVQIDGTLTVTGGSLTGNGGEVYSSYGSYSSYGVYAFTGIKVTGGSLTGNGGEANMSFGVYASGDLEISGTGSLTATGGNADSSSYGVRTEGTLTVTGGSLMGIGGEAYGSYGVCTQGMLTVSGGSLAGNGGNADSSSYGVHTDTGIEVTGGSLTGNSGSSTAQIISYGVNTYGTLTVTGGSLTATGGKALSYSYGLHAAGDLKVSGTGSLTGTGGEAPNFSYGVLATATVTVSETGKLTAAGGSAWNSYGLYASGDLEISGTGSLTATGGNADYESCGVYTYGTLTMGEHIAILTPVGGSFDDGQNAVIDTEGNIAAEVKIGRGYTVSVNAAANGTVSGAGAYAEGASVTLTVTPSEGYKLESLTVDGKDVTASVQNGTYTFTMPAKAVAVTATFVEAITRYDLWVGGQQFTSKNLTISGTSGTAAYDPETNTLTLNGYTYEGAGYMDAAIYYSGSDTLELALVNDSSVTHVGSSNESRGVHVDTGSITISGTGSLTATGGEVDTNGDGGSYGIRASKDITILSGTVTATGSKAEGAHGSGSYGIFSQGQITISGGTVTATADEVVTRRLGGSSGLYAFRGINISGGTVTAAGGNMTGDEDDICGVSTNGSLTITGGSLTATSGNVTGNDCTSYGVKVEALTMGEGISILTPAGGSFDAEQKAVVDASGNIATEVKIAEKPDPVDVTLKLTKEFNDWDKADGFTFNLAAVTENAPMPANPSATATEDTPATHFGEITFTAAGIYEYTITEVDSGIPGVTYDTSAHKIVVTVTENAEDNKLIAKVTYDGEESLIITNTYTEATPYDLWVGGQQFTSEKLTISGTTGTAAYDPEKGALTLNNYTYSGAGYKWAEATSWGDSFEYAGAIYYGGDRLKLVLEGENSVTHINEDDGRSCGMFVKGGLEISGPGSLTVVGGAANWSFGVYAENDITINSGTLTAISGTAVSGFGVFTNNLFMGNDIGILAPIGGRFSPNDWSIMKEPEHEVATSVKIGAGYTVSVVTQNGTISGGGRYDAGDTVTLTVTPDEGYALNTLTVDGTDVTASVQDGTYTFTMPAKAVTVAATFIRTYNLWVGGQQFTSEKLTISGTTGTATYAPETNTLTLDGYTYQGAGEDYAAIYYGGIKTLNLVLEGENRVTHTDNAVRFGYGIHVNRGLHISGTGSLNVTGSDSSDQSFGISAEDITMAGGTVTATGGKAETFSYGVHANGGVTITGGSLTGIGGEEAVYGSCGVDVVADIKVAGGSLTGIGKKSEYMSCGIYANHNLTVSSGVLTAIGSETTDNGSYGVVILGSLSMGEGIRILTPEGGLYDADNFAVVDAAGNIATEVKIGAACDHSGNENEHTDCTVDFVCSVCNAVITEAKENHDYVNHFCSVCGMEEPVYLAFLSLSLKGNIGVNYYMHIDETIAADETGYMAFTTPRGGTVQIPIGQANVKTVSGQTYYVFTATVAAKEMTDTINGQYIWQDGSTGSYDYSVKQYADIIIANESGSAAYDKAKPMVQAMLNYGAYAQVDFGYNTDDLAADLSQADVSGVTAQTLSGFANANKQGTALAPLYAATLVLKTETTLRLFFRVDASVTSLTVTRGETGLTVADKSGLKYCALENISAKDLDADYTVTVNDGTESADVTYNPMSYCYNVLNAAEGTYEESLCNAVRALYLYNQAANAYFG